jgi:pyridoxine 5-phosphate synthase
MILGVNIDHVATLRQARLGREPDPLMAAPLAVLGGADGITVHLREDRRHIKDRDLRLLKEVVPVELNLEMAPTREMIKIASLIRPDMVTLVPEKRQELTTEGGLEMKALKKKIGDAVGKLQDAGLPVSLFINPDLDDIEAAKKTGAEMVEIHTGMYANARGLQVEAELMRIHNAVGFARERGLLANAGHGLNYSNVRRVAAIRGLRGLYIGHSIVCRAVLVGLEMAVREMKELIGSAQWYTA